MPQAEGRRQRLPRGRRLTPPCPGLGRVGGELLAIGEATREDVAFLRRPHWPLRLAAVALVFILVAVLVTTVTTVIGLGDRAGAGSFGNMAEAVQAVESLVQEAVFIGIAVWFFLSLESRLKRRRALRAIHRLRSILWQKITLLDQSRFAQRPDGGSMVRGGAKAAAILPPAA